MLRRRELPWSRCLELLCSHGVGRIAASSPDGPLIYPVNYTVLHEDIWFRLPAHSGVAGQIGSRAVVALQVDRIDEEDPAGWAVQVRGRALSVGDPELLEKVRETWYPRPWSVPGRFVYFRLPLEDVTGREFEAPADEPAHVGTEAT